MATNVGSMEVEYTVNVNRAIKNLEQYNKIIEKNSIIQNRSAKQEKVVSNKQRVSEKVTGKGRIAGALKMTKAFNIAAISIAAVVGGMYSIIKASSYGKIYMEQFGATTQQLANLIMEETGLNVALESGLRAYQKFVDKLAEDPVVAIMVVIGDFAIWMGKFITPVVDAGRAFQKFLDNLKEVGVWETIKALIYDFGIWVWDNLGLLFPRIGLVVKAFWDFLISKDWIQLATDTFGRFVDWININMLDKAYYWGMWILSSLQLGIESLLEIVAALIPDGIKEGILDIISKCYQFGVDIMNKIKKAILDNPIVIKIKAAIESSWNSLSGGTTSAGNRKGNWGAAGKSVNDAIISPSGKIITTNPADYLIATKTPGDLGGKGGNTYNISPIINISSSGSNNDITRQVSKAIADEIRRMTKI